MQPLLYGKAHEYQRAGDRRNSTSGQGIGRTGSVDDGSADARSDGDRDIADRHDEPADLLKPRGFSPGAPAEHCGRDSSETKPPECGGGEKAGDRSAGQEHGEHSESQHRREEEDSGPKRTVGQGAAENGAQDAGGSEHEQQQGQTAGINSGHGFCSRADIRESAEVAAEDQQHRSQSHNDHSGAKGRSEGTKPARSRRSDRRQRGRLYEQGQGGDRCGDEEDRPPSPDFAHPGTERYGGDGGYRYTGVDDGQRTAEMVGGHQMRGHGGGHCPEAAQGNTEQEARGQENEKAGCQGNKNVGEDGQ